MKRSRIILNLSLLDMFSNSFSIKPIIHSFALRENRAADD